MSQAKQIPRFFDQTHPKHQTPTRSLIVTAIACWLACLSFSFVEALTINSVIRLITYAVVCAALPILRRRSDVPRANYATRSGPWVAGAALLLCAWLLSRVSAIEIIQVLGAIVIGATLYALVAAKKR